MHAKDFVVEPKYIIGPCKEILRDWSKHSVIEAQVSFDKRDIVQRIGQINPKDDASIDMLGRFIEQEAERIRDLEDFAVNFAVQEILEQIWAHQASTFIKTMLENYSQHKEREKVICKCLNLLLYLVRKQNQQGCNYFIYLWRERIDSPSILNVFLHADDWEIALKILLIIQDCKFDESIKQHMKWDITRLPFSQQIHMGFFTFTNYCATINSGHHFPLKNHYVNLVNYSHDSFFLFRKRDSHAFQISHQQNLPAEAGDLVFRFDTSATSPRSSCIWQMFLNIIGERVYLEANIHQMQMELFEAFIEFKFALTCRQNFTQSSYFSMCYRKISSFTSTNKFSLLKNICSSLMKKEMSFTHVVRQTLTQQTLNLVRDMLANMEKRGWIFHRQDEVSEEEILELEKDQFFRFVWDTMLYDGGNMIYILHDQYKIEVELFGKLEDFVFTYYLNTKRNPYVNYGKDMTFPNGTHVETSNSYFYLFFTQFKTSYDKITMNEGCLHRGRLFEIDSAIKNWQMQFLQNLIDHPESFAGKQGILSSAQFPEIMRRYSEDFRIAMIDKLSDLFTMILSRSVSTDVLSEEYIVRVMQVCTSTLTDQKRIDLIKQCGLPFFDQLLEKIEVERNTRSAFTFAILLQQSSDSVRNRLIEFIVGVENPSERRKKILRVSELLVGYFRLNIDVFLCLSKCDIFIINQKQDIEAQQDLFDFYVKYYAETFLNKGSVMMHSQFFNQSGSKLFLRTEMLRMNVLENLLARLEKDLKAEIEFYLKDIDKSDRISHIAYHTMLNIKYTFLIHNLRQYFDVTLTLSNPSASQEEKQNIKEDILRHAIFVYRMLLLLNNMFTSSLSNQFLYLSNIRTTVLRFMEIITSNSHEDVDFTKFFCALFAGINNNPQQVRSFQKMELLGPEYILKESDIFKLFESFTLVSKFYYDQDKTLLEVKDQNEVDVLQLARKVEVMALVLKKFIKYLNESNKKLLISKYFVTYHISHLKSSFEIGSRVQRLYVTKLMRLKTVEFDERVDPSERVVPSVQDEDILKAIYKRIKCFVNIARLGMSLEIHGKSADQMQAYTRFRDFVVKSYNYVLFGNSTKKKYSPKMTTPPTKKNNLVRKGNRSGLAIFLQGNPSQGEKILIHELVCMKYFAIIKQLLQLQLHRQPKNPPNEQILFIDNTNFINCFTHMFKVFVAHIQEYHEDHQESSHSQSLFGSLLQIKKKISTLSSLIPLVFEEFALFMLKRFPQTIHKATSTSTHEQSVPLLSAKHFQKVDDLSFDLDEDDLDDGDEYFDEFEFENQRVQTQNQEEYQVEWENQVDDQSEDEMEFEQEGDDQYESEAEKYDTETNQSIGDNEFEQSEERTKSNNRLFCCTKMSDNEFNENELLCEEEKNKLFQEHGEMRSDDKYFHVQQDNDISPEDDKQNQQGKLQVENEMAHSKQKQIKETHLNSRTIKFEKLVNLISLFMQNLTILDFGDANQIILRVADKQLGQKISTVQTLYFLDAVYSSLSSFYLCEAIQFKQFLSNFYHTVHQGNENKPEASHLELKACQVKSETTHLDPETTHSQPEIHDKSQTLNYSIHLQNENEHKKPEAIQTSHPNSGISYAGHESFQIDNTQDLVQKQKILLFLEITLLNSGDNTKVITHSQTLIEHIQEKLLPYVRSLSQNISDQNTSLPSHQQRANFITNIIATISVISYYLQYIELKATETELISSAFHVMSSSISIFQECVILLQSLNIDYDSKFEKEARKKIANIHTNIAQRFLTLSLQLILTSRQPSIHLFIHLKIISITSSICIPQVNSIRNSISILIFSIIYEILNTLTVFQNTIEFSLKHSIFSSSSSDCINFQFQDKYSNSLDLAQFQIDSKQFHSSSILIYFQGLVKILNFCCSFKNA